MMREIERRFLVTELPRGLEECPRHEIAQAYLAIDPGGTQVRLRRSNNECCLTEVEFSDVDKSTRFQPPAWFGEEVTRNSRYANSALARE